MDVRYMLAKLDVISCRLKRHKDIMTSYANSLPRLTLETADKLLILVACMCNIVCKITGMWLTRSSQNFHKSSAMFLGLY